MGNRPVAVRQWWINPLPCFNRTSSSSHYWGIKHPFQSKRCERRNTGKWSWITPTPLDQRDPSPRLSPWQTDSTAVFVLCHIIYLARLVLCAVKRVALIWHQYDDILFRVSGFPISPANRFLSWSAHYLPETRFQCSVHLMLMITGNTRVKIPHWLLQVRLNDRLTTSNATAVLMTD